MCWTKEDLDSVRKLYVTVTNDAGDIVYQTWNSDDGWSRVVLYLNESEAPLTDANATVMGEIIGKSHWS